MKLNVKPKNRGTPAGAPDYQLYFRSQTVNTVQRSKILYNFYLVKKKKSKEKLFLFHHFPKLFVFRIYSTATHNMSNSFSYWNGQPLNAPVYPQMGDFMQHSAAGAAAPPPLSATAAAPGLGSAGGLGGWPSQGAAQAHSMLPYAGGAGGMPAAMPGAMPGVMPGAMSGAMPGAMPGAMSCGMPITGAQHIVPPPVDRSIYGDIPGRNEPCIDNGEAFCAYNGMDMSMNYGGGSASKGGFW